MNNNKRVNKNQAVSIINSTKGKFFTVTFVTKSGTQRTINGNTKTSKGAVNKLGYISVYSPQLGGYRNVNSQTIKSIRFDNTTYVVR